MSRPLALKQKLRRPFGEDTMKLKPLYLVALAPVAVAGAVAGLSGAVLGHLAVLAVTLGIFFGTLSLGRHTGAAPATSQSVAAQVHAQVNDVT